MNKFDKYDSIGPDYHYRQINRASFKSFSAPVAARFEDLVDKVAKATEDKPLKLLDVGCGDGVALYLLNKRLPNLELYGIEPEEKAINILKTKVPKAEVKQGLAYPLPYEDNYFDIVISSDVIEHVEDAEEMLREMKRVAKPEATVIVGTPIKFTDKPLDHNHTKEFFPEEFLGTVSKFFKEPKLFETHHLGHMLFYNAPTKNFLNFKYLINLLSLVFGWNPFRRGRRTRVELFAYQTVVCKK